MLGGCVIGTVFAGVGGLDSNQRNSSIRATAIVLLICYLCLAIVWIISTCLICFYGLSSHTKIGNDQTTHEHDPARTLTATSRPAASAPSIHIHNTSIFTTSASQDQMRNIQQQNQNLQQQVTLQQQLLTEQLEQQGILQEQLRRQRSQQQPTPPENEEPPPPYNSVIGNTPPPPALYKKY